MRFIDASLGIILLAIMIDTANFGRNKSSLHLLFLGQNGLEDT